MKTVSDIRFTNIDEETVEHFTMQFDKYLAHFEVETDLLDGININTELKNLSTSQRICST